MPMISARERRPASRPRQGYDAAVGRCTHAILGVALLLLGLALVRAVPRHLESGPPPVLAVSEPSELAMEPPSIDAARDLDELQSIVRAIADERLTAGVSFAVVEDGRTVWVEGLGLADIAANRRATADTVYRVGSLTKSMLAITMASLEDEGRLDLEAPVRDLVPDVQLLNPWEATDPIRVTDLLQHSAGFDEMRFNETFATRDQLDWSPAQVLALNPRSRHARWRPGTRHAYSHPGYTVAGHIVETITGRPYEAVVRERVFDPLGMRVASFVPTPAVEAELAVAYREGGRARQDHWLLHHRPGSHVYTSAREMGRYLELLTGRGIVDGARVVPERVIERIERGSTLPYPDLVPSYGLGIYATQRDGVLWYSHGGWMPGYHSSLRYMASIGSGYAIMTNEAVDVDAVWAIEREIMAYLAREAPPAVPQPRVEVEPGALDALAGTYAHRSYDIEFARAFDLRRPVVVDVVGHDLRMRCCNGEVEELVPVGSNRFRRADQTHASAMFTTSRDGEAVLFDGNGFAYHERIPAARAIGFRVLLVFTFAALGLGILWTVLWMGPALGGRVRAGLRAWPCAGAWSVYFFVDTLYEAPLTELGTFNWTTASIFALSWAIPVCAIGSIAVVARDLVRGRDKIVPRIAASLITIGVVAATVHFALHGVIGVRTWLW